MHACAPLACSVLTTMAPDAALPAVPGSLDTGRLNAETYRLFDAVEKHYGIHIEYTFPDAQETMNLVRTKGMFSFYNDGHNECCKIRKVRGAMAVTALSQGQHVSRLQCARGATMTQRKGQNSAQLVRDALVAASANAQLEWCGQPTKQVGMPRWPKRVFERSSMNT